MVSHLWVQVGEGVAWRVLMVVAEIKRLERELERTQVGSRRA